MTYSIGLKGLWTIEFKNPKHYVDEKINMVQRDFKVSVSESDKNYLYSLKTEIAIDNAFQRIIYERLDDFEKMGY